MCISPNTLLDGTVIACRKCWQCREQAVNDWVGRNIAESKTAVECNAVTLTYGRNEKNDVDHERAAMLTYSDVQKYLKLLRRHGFPVRYFVTGEYGSTKGRAHWHIMLYWQRPMSEALKKKWFPGGTAWRNDPDTKRWVSKSWDAGDIPMDWNIIDVNHWDHGWSFWCRGADPANIRYNCKYIQKDIGDDARQGHLAMSKQPPLGALYFQTVADEYVAAGLAPQSLEYSFADVKRKRKDGTLEVVPFRLKGVSGEMFLDRYMESWASMYGDKPMPKSELLDAHVLGHWDEAKAIRQRLTEWGPSHSWTVKQIVQARYDTARLEQLDKMAKGNEAFVTKVRELNPITRQGPRSLNEWQVAWDRYENGEQLDIQQKQRQAVAKRVELVLAEVYGRQGRVAVDDGEGLAFVLPDEE